MPRRGWALSILAVALLGGTLAVAPGAGADPSTGGVSLVSRNADGTPVDAGLAAITPDGRYVLGVGGLTNAPTVHYADVFLADGATGAASAPSADMTGARGWADAIGVTPDARTVVWDIVYEGQTAREVFVTDRTAGTRRHALSLPADVGQNRRVSEDGRTLFFLRQHDGDSQTPWDPYTADLGTGQVRRVDARPDGTGPGVRSVAMTRDGSAVIFLTTDAVLWPGLPSGQVGVLRRDLQTGALTQLTTRPSWSALVGMSPDGRVLLLADQGLWAWSAAGTSRADGLPDGSTVGNFAGFDVSDDGRFVTFTASPSGAEPRVLYQRDLRNAVTTIVGRDPAGEIIRAVDRFDASNDGGSVAFSDRGPATGRLIVRHIGQNDTTAVLCCDGTGAGFVSAVRIDRDGRRAAFETWTARDDGNFDRRVLRWDDPSTRPAVSASFGRGEEPSTAVTWTIHVDHAVDFPVSVQWSAGEDDGVPTIDRATAGVDFQPTSGTATIPAGALTATVSAPVLDDQVHEHLEHLHLQLTGATGADIADPVADGYIAEDDPLPVVDVADASAPEASGRLVWRLTLDRPSVDPIEVPWYGQVDPMVPAEERAAADLDFTPTRGVLTVEPGATSGTVSVPLLDDQLLELPERLAIKTGTARNAQLGRDQAVGTILDDERVPVLSVAGTHVAEDAGKPMAWTVSLDAPSGLPVTVSWWSYQDTSAPSDRRAAPDKDFKPAAGSLTFAPGETSKTASSLVFDDGFFERDEWFVVELFGARGATLGQAKATGTINDDESARLWGLPTQLARLLPA